MLKGNDCTFTLLNVIMLVTSYFADYSTVLDQLYLEYETIYSGIEVQ